jgi:hypothetical protein
MLISLQWWLTLTIFNLPLHRCTVKRSSTAAAFSKAAETGGGILIADGRRMVRDLDL